MQEWWIGLTGIQQLLWGLAIPSTLIFVLQMGASLLFGIDDDPGAIDSDTSLSIFDYFTLRTAVAFFLGFSWGGLACFEAGISILWAIFIGLFMVGLNLFLLKGLATLNESGNLILENAVGATATVTIRIPAKLAGCGKVTVSIQGRFEELEACTEGKEILRGQTVTVASISDNNQFIVTPKNIG